MTPGVITLTLTTPGVITRMTPWDDGSRTRVAGCCRRPWSSSRSTGSTGPRWRRSPRGPG
ncbi:protein of unknown function [Streptantibioticus cattleyicolor NRRL 8057 = DSM 46488]|nr:protein of unknown function [Streptantibioticus cattleyicolor NRRL 8057 = DSM 46488]